MIVSKEDVERLSKLDTVDKVLQEYNTILEQIGNMESIEWRNKDGNIFVHYHRPLVGEDPEWVMYISPNNADSLAREFTDGSVAVGDNMRYAKNLDEYIYEVVWDRLYGMRV